MVDAPSGADGLINYLYRVLRVVVDHHGGVEEVVTDAKLLEARDGLGVLQVHVVQGPVLFCFSCMIFFQNKSDMLLLKSSFNIWTTIGGPGSSVLMRQAPCGCT